MATSRPHDRRSFLRLAGATGAALLATPERILADPYAPLARVLPRDSRPLRIRGAVRAGGRGVGGVAVSDGLRVVETDADGRFEIRSTTDRDFVRVSVPAGHALPVTEYGTAAFHRAIPSTPGVGEMETVFDLERLEVDDREHALLLLPDIQTQTAQEMEWFHARSVPDVRATVEALGHREIVGAAAGDIMYDDLELYPEYERGVARMGVPFVQVVGNHDLDFDGGTDEATTATFSRHFGPRYYSFDRGAVHYVMLDDVFWHGTSYVGYLDRDQLRWLEADLARVEPGRPVIVILHIPVRGSRYLRDGERRPGASVSVNNREVLYRLLEPFRAHILCGHTHENDHVFEHGTHEHVSGTVSGAWWSGPICADGTPGGYSVYEVSGEEVRWRYKATGLPAEHQMRVYPVGSDPTAPREVVANVWDWDPEWRVVWYEDGERRGEMARRVGLDPLSVELHAGEELPLRRTWVDPYPTRHLFYAPVSPETREVRVEATDRFGRVYSETVDGAVPSP